MAVKKSDFGTNPTGQEINLYTITNQNGVKASVTNFGAILVKLIVPDQNGEARDVVLGYDSAEGYDKNPSFFGATIGPSANRIANAKFTIDDTTYMLDPNDGNNNLHSHIKEGYHKRIWDVETTENSVIFTLEDKDNSMGFPGNKSVQVSYTLDEKNALAIHYHITSDKKTVINPTNHTYFNLEGHNGGGIETHKLRMKASNYTPVVAGAIPTGEIATVSGTPMDFTKTKEIGQDINADNEQLKLTGGYDHNWVIDDWDGDVQKFAIVTAPTSGIKMKVYTDLPGVQFYAGNFITPEVGKDGVSYKQRSGLCLETQYYPNSVNQSNFPPCIFGEGQEYDSTTVYKFEV